VAPFTEFPQAPSRITTVIAATSPTTNRCGGTAPSGPEPGTDVGVQTVGVL
jgi:hypothetical protein